jgi:peptidoglycan/LPS O-acetylase OafA/YrhL
MTQLNGPHLVYRPDIDGLRAFAVLSVLIFHAFPSVLPGGFVGVDIFFVISGYLISGIMFKALDAGKFSFSEFYARRIKRIFPALTLVLFVSWVVGWFVLFNDELKQLGNHLARAAIFLSNFILWRESGYFDNAAETKPLLHLWSLGIEEQFYIVWPLVVWCVWRFKSWRLRLMWVMTACSFLWNVYQSQHDLTHDFYSPLTRFWELSSGALLAYAMGKKGAKPFAQIPSGLGVGLLLLAVMLVNGGHSFPGAWALLPVLGTVLVISANSHTGCNRALFSHPLAVWVGTISYPLYLWHWPLLSFARIVEGEAPSLWLRVAAFLASFVLAWWTFVLIEKPLRLTWAYKFKTHLLALGMTVVCALGYATHKHDGFPEREVMQKHHVVYEGDIGHNAFHRYFQDHFYPCAAERVQQDAGSWEGIVRCFQSRPHASVDLLLLGDSHAEHLFIGVAEQLPQVNVASYIRKGLPLLSAKEFKLVFDEVLGDPHIKSVMISAMWSSIGASSLTHELDQTVKALQAAGKKVYVVDDIPRFEFDPQRCKFQRPLTRNTKCDEPVSLYQKQRAVYFSALQEVQALNPNMELVRAEDLMCTAHVCSMVRGSTVLYRDNNHLNIPGSQYVGEQFVQRVPTLLQLNR